MPSDFSQRSTRTWRASFGSGASAASLPEDWLRQELSNLRDRAELLVGEIHRDLPEFTRHDISHCDALWEMADIVGGEALTLNPAEGFVLGAVFLLHDAALGLAALPGRIADLQRDPLWHDTVDTALRARLGRRPTPDELAEVDDGRNGSIQQWVAAAVLRARHASLAERLALQPYSDSDGRPFYLIEDEALRTHFGRDIGRIAASHGTSLDSVASSFANQPPLAAIAGRYPAEWQVDRLKLACLLRTCDAIHLDSRRAPAFLRALRRPSPSSDPHWLFQSHISVSGEEGRVLFSSGHAFTPEEAIAWWTGYDLIQTADRELRQVDALLADLRRPRFASRSVFGAESPQRLAATIPTDGWIPIDARVRVSNVSALVRSLGGENLYGDSSRLSVPLRELIQNARDAVRARCTLDPGGRYSTRGLGEVVVRQGHDHHGHWVEVEDNGLGMSVGVLTGALLEFGSSLWNTPRQHEEWPGLAGRGFEPVGRYGIGFFSVFMWGNRVRVTTRRFDQGHDGARVLEWQRGLDWHPLLRVARADERISEGGTRVRVWTEAAAGGNSSANATRGWDLAGICAVLCPALDVDLRIEAGDGGQAIPEYGDAIAAAPQGVIVRAGDWVECDGRELLRRVWADYYATSHLQDPDLLQAIASNLDLLRDGDRVVGRACLFDWRLGFKLFGSANYRTGCITAGGLRAAELVSSIAGVLVGEPQRAARDEAIPLVGTEELSRWATAQAPRFASLSEDANQHLAAARTVRYLGGHTGPLAITVTGADDGRMMALSHDDIVASEVIPDEVALLDFTVLEWTRLAPLRLRPSVFLTGHDMPSLMSKRNSLFYVDWKLSPPERVRAVTSPDWDQRYRTLAGALIEALAARWQCSIAAILEASTLRGAPDGPPPEREVGDVNGQPLRQQVGLLRRP